MLLVIQDSILEIIRDPDSNPNIQLLPFLQISLSVREGLHIVTGRPNVVRKVRSEIEEYLVNRNCGFGQAVISFLRHVEEGSPETASLISRVRHFVSLVGPSSEVLEAYGDDQWRPAISIMRFQARDLCDPVSVVVENPSDARSIYHIANAYILSNIGTNMIARFETLNGGGSTIAATWRDLLRRKFCFSVCLCDSDRNFEYDSLGATARHAQAVFEEHSQQKPCVFLVTSGRELENDIPMEHMADVWSGTLSKREAARRLVLLKSLDQALYRYIDVKVGFSLCWALSLTGPVRALFVQLFQKFAMKRGITIGYPYCALNQRCSGAGHGDCSAIAPLGNSILSEFATSLEAQSPAAILNRLRGAPFQRYIGDLAEVALGSNDRLVVY